MWVFDPFKNLETQEKLTPIHRDRDLFLSALENPPKLKGKLKSAIAAYRDKYGE